MDIILDLIKNINWFIDMWYHYRRLTNRLSRIRYYRRHRKIKPEPFSIISIFRESFKVYFSMFKIESISIYDRNEWRREVNRLYDLHQEKRKKELKSECKNISDNNKYYI